MKAIIQVATPNLQQSLDFYKKLEFSTYLHDKTHFFIDGTTVVEVNSNRKVRNSIKMYDYVADETLDKLQTLGTVIQNEEQIITASPSGVWVYLTTEKAPPIPSEAQGKHSKLGNCVGISLESIDLEKSLAFWKALGFVITMGSPDQGWVALEDQNGTAISIMKALSCPHLFFNPSLTYFNGKQNEEIIEKIRQADISITEEVTAFNDHGIVDNVIIRDPGGLGFFVFND